MRLYFFRFFMSLSLVVSLPLFSFAVTSEEDIQELILSYVNAVNGTDLNLVKSAWTDLSRNPEALAYMRANMPELTHLYNIRGLYFQMAAIEEEQKNLAALQGGGVPSFEAAALQKQKNALNTGPTIQPFSLSEPEVDPLPSNGEIVRRAPLGVRRDNYDIVMANPNQNRESNQSLIQGRAEGYYNRKFQESPDILVPRIPEPQTLSAADTPKVKVRGSSVQVLFSQFPASNRTLTAFMNRRQAIANAPLSKDPQSFTLYLEPGLNTLSVALNAASPGADASTSQSLRVIFPSTVEGRQRFSWDLKSGESQTLTIEVVP